MRIHPYFKRNYYSKIMFTFHKITKLFSKYNSEIHTTAKIKLHELVEFYIHNASKITVEILINVLRNNKMIVEQPVTEEELKNIISIPFIDVNLKDIFSNGVLNCSKLAEVISYTNKTKRAGVYI